MFFSTECRHCRAVIRIIERYITAHPEIELTKIDATTRENTDLLEATLKGRLSVPILVVNDLYLIEGDANVLQRLTYALQLSENMPEQQETEQKWLLRK